MVFHAEEKKCNLKPRFLLAHLNLFGVAIEQMFGLVENLALVQAYVFFRLQKFKGQGSNTEACP